MQFKTKALRLAGAAMIAVAIAPWLGGTSASAAPPSEDCPAGTTPVAKYSFNGEGYSADFGGDVVTVTSGDADGGTFTSTQPISDVFVKGGTDTKVDHYDPAVTSGSFSNVGLLNEGDQVPAISHVTFCASSGESSTPVVTTSTPVVTTSTPVVTTSTPVVTTSTPVVTTTSAPVTTSAAATTTASQQVSVLPVQVENTTAEESEEAETEVLGVKAGTLPHTGSGLPVGPLLVVSLGLLLGGGALMLLPGLAVEKGKRRRH